MSINCDVILKWSATPEQLTALGTALWRWCGLVTRDKAIYQFLDNQALADLIAGTFPASAQTERRGLHLWVRDETSPNRRTAIESLRRELPSEGVEDVLIDGMSWALIAWEPSSRVRPGKFGSGQP
jgi:hypothetical protein